MSNSFNTYDTLTVNGRAYHFANLQKLPDPRVLQRLPFSLKIVLENLLRHEDGGRTVTVEQIQSIIDWRPDQAQRGEISFMPARVVLQDFTGVPCVVDLAALREAVVDMGGSADAVTPQIPSELVIDHSIQVDVFGREDSLQKNGAIEFERNQERYEFLRWGQQAFGNLKVVPPNTGIVHQVNLEHLARVVMERDINGETWLFPDTVFGTDSHTTMINGLGVLGWGVGGIEAEAAMLGEPSSMVIPDVVGVKLVHSLREGVTATDLVLTVTQKLRQLGVVGKFVEFFGDGVGRLSLADRATIANMAPEYGATCGLFPIDQETLAYLRLSGRTPDHIALVEAYAKAQGLWHDDHTPHAQYTTVLEVDLSSVVPSLAGPKRPQDRVDLENVASNFALAVGDLARRSKDRSEQAHDFKAEGGGQEQASVLAEPVAKIRLADVEHELRDGSVVIAAITSCTNTSNPSVMLAAGLLARKAVQKGLRSQPWVKTSLAPGSKVVNDYLRTAGVLEDLEALGFYVVGYGCTTCIGNSGPLPQQVSEGIAREKLVVASVLSGNRNFEGRVHPEVKANYLASPPLVVAYALAGRVDIDLTQEPLGIGLDGREVYLKDIWPTTQDIGEAIAHAVHSEMFTRNYTNVFEGDERWNAMTVPSGRLYEWNTSSTYIKKPPYFDKRGIRVEQINGFENARILGLFGDSITTDHISPAGAIKADSPAGRYLQERGVAVDNFNSYGSRRGNDEVMVRGTFANIRLKNLALDNIEGGFAHHYGPQGRQTLPIFDAAMAYKKENVPLVVIAGKEYGTGSSRDWAAKGTLLLGVKAVIAESFERIHRSNLVGMGVLPCRFRYGDNARSLGLDGSETIDLLGVSPHPNGVARVRATKPNGRIVEFEVDVLVQTPKEMEYMRHGGLLPFVVRKLLG